MIDYSREKLIEICEKSIVPQEKWRSGLTPSAQENVGLCWGLLKAGCTFHLLVKPNKVGDFAVTNERNIWLRIQWPSFLDIECGEDGDCSNDELFYLPTEKRLEENEGGDWY
jgi:hypothetical protein